MSLNNMFERYGDSLVSRDSDGIYVALFYDRKADEVFVYYANKGSGESFTIDPPKHLAMDCYMHPIVYRDAAMRGISNPHRLNPIAV